MKLRDIRRIEKKDIQCAILLIIAFFPSLIIRMLYRHIWIFIERINNADDNAWMLFKWIRTEHPEINAFYLLDKTNVNFNSQDKHFIAWGSLRHYIYYLASDIHIMATFQKTRPSNRICSYFENIIKNNIKTIYVRHGIHKDGPEEHLYSLHHFRLFVCGAKPEYDFMKMTAGYPTDNIKYLGLARFDDLLIDNISENFILLIPTWRRYIGLDKSKSNEENNKIFIESIFYKYYVSLLNNPKLISFLMDNNLKIKFCLHAEYRVFEDLFKSCNNKVIEIVDKKESIHNLLKKNKLLITDYSSVFFDAAYANKPVIYYQFDYQEFRKYHLSEGYFDYKKDGFGPVIDNENSLVSIIIKSYNNNQFIFDPIYKKRTKIFFPLHDQNNCKRIYEEIIKIQNNG